MEKEKEREIEIDLGKIFHMMKKRVIYIILATLITGVLSGCITEFLIQPKYSASCTMYVYSNTDRVSSSASIGQSELSASQQLVNTYIEVLKSNYVLEDVISALNLDMTTKQLRSMLSFSQINETEIFKVTVTSTNAAQSADIANAIAKTAPDAIVKKIKAGGVSVLDYAKVPSAPSSPNLKKNILIGAIAGFAVSFIGFFVYELFDTTITTERDLERAFDIPVIGSIPRLVPSASKAGDGSTNGALDSKKGGKE